MAWLICGAAMLASCGGDTPNTSAGGAPSAPEAVPAQPVQSGEAAVPEQAQERREAATVQHAGLLPDRAAIVSHERVDGAIAFDFRANEAPARVLAWYRGRQPARGFAVTSELQEGAEHVVSGTTRQPAGDFSVRIAPDGSGGTTAMVLVTLRQ